MDTGIYNQEFKANKNFTIIFSGKLLSGIVQFNYIENDQWLIEKKRVSGSVGFLQRDGA